MVTKRLFRKKISWFDVINNALVLLITLITLYPLYFIVIASFSDPNEVAAGRTLLWFKGFTLDAYKNILNEKSLWTGYRNTIIYTVLGTLYNLVLTIPAAFVLTKQWLPFRGAISWYFFLTMYVSGGMIPGYLLIKSLNLIDNPLLMIIGSGVSCYNMIVCRQFFATSIPSELYEASYIDGASEWTCFRRVALPLAKPIIAVMCLYYGVGHWNSYYGALLYLRDSDYFPLQLVLRSILLSNESLNADVNTAMEQMEYLLAKMHAAQGMKYAIIFIASAPLLIIYPFLQKYFVKGVMVGSVKG